MPKNFNRCYKNIDKGLEINRYLYLDRLLGGNPSFVFIIPSYNNINNVTLNLKSVFSQLYLNYRVIYIDDCSIDGTNQLVTELVSEYDMWGKFRLYRQPKRNYQSGSRFSAYHLCDDDEILCMLDGDDWLSHNRVLNELVNLYKNGSMVTYGSYQLYNGMGIEKIIYGNEIFPNAVISNRNFRNYRWTSCHLRTGYAGLFKKIKLCDMLDRNNQFLRCCTDLCEMYCVLEMGSPYIDRCVTPLYIYNRVASQLNSNSYYNRNKNPIEKVYREYAMDKIKTTPKYSKITKQELFKSMNIDLDEKRYCISSKLLKMNRNKLLKLLKLLEITSLHYLGVHLELDNILILYDNKIKIGNLLTLSGNMLVKKRGYDLKLNDLVISIDNLDIELWDK